jgi:hypothetical protein
MRSLAVALVLCAVAAHAEVRNELVVTGIKAYDDLDYPRAVRLLTRALGEPLSDEERVAVYQRLAYCHIAFEDEQATRADFQQLLKIDPRFKLDAGASPRMRALFDDVRSVMEPPPVAKPKPEPVRVTPPPVGKPPTLSAQPDARPTVSQPLEVRASLAGADAAQVRLFHRARGGGAWSRVEAERRGGSWSATIPGLWVASPGVDYYLLALDGGGREVAALGTAEAPLTVDVAVRARPLWARPAFLGAVGILAGIVVAIGLVVGFAWPHSTAPDTPSTIMIITH